MEETKKYELTGETREICGAKNGVVYRIRATRDFGAVEKGTLGGFVESEANLSQDGDCWVRGYATVCGNALVCDNAQVYGAAVVRGNARVCDNAFVLDSARALENAVVSESSRVRGCATIRDGATICGEAVVGGEAVVAGRSVVGGKAYVGGEAVVGNFAIVCEPADVLSIASLRSSNSVLTFFRAFAERNGEPIENEKTILATYKNYYFSFDDLEENARDVESAEGDSELRAAIALAKVHFGLDAPKRSAFAFLSSLFGRKE